MATRQRTKSNSKNTQKIINCEICGDTITPACDWNQGRCPHRLPLVDFTFLKEKFMKQPDPKLHFQISMLKSLLRISAGLALIVGNILISGSLFILAEVLGIAEELV